MKVKIIQRIKRKIQGKSYQEILSIVRERLLPLISHHEYYLYEDQNKDEYSFIQPKLKQTQFLHFSNYSTFKKYQEEHRISLMDFDEGFIQDSLLQGAWAFCAFIDQKLAHITWIAFDEKAKTRVEPWPMKVDWSSEVCWGNARTGSSFRRLGLYSCVHAQLGKYLKENGYKKNKFSMKKNNNPSNKAMSIFQPKVFADGHKIKILFWQFRMTTNRMEG